MIIKLAVLGAIALLLLVMSVVRWWAARGIEDDRGPDDDVPPRDRWHLMPEGHRPPPGLSPLSPSERFLAAETSRGFRDLQMFLIDAG